MNRHQKKALSLVVAISNLSFSVAAASVATYAWFYENKKVTATGMSIQSAIPDSKISWEILRYDDDYKAGLSYDNASEFYLQDYDEYLTQKNKYTNCILVASIEVDSFTNTSQLYVDVSCAPGHSPAYNQETPEYTSNVCQFKATAYSYTVQGSETPVVLNSDISNSTPATRYSTASTYFSNYSQYAKFVSVINNTPYKRSTTITLEPNLNGLPNDTQIKNLVIYVECSYDPNLVRYYIDSHSNGIGSSVFSLNGDITKINFRTGTVHSGAYVKVNNNVDLDTGDYIIGNKANNVSLDGSLSDFTNYNYVDMIETKNRIKNSELMESSKFSYDASTDKLTSASNNTIGSNGTAIGTSSSYTNTASASNGVATITNDSKKLSFDSTAGTTKFNYLTGDSNISVYKYDVNAQYDLSITNVTFDFTNAVRTFSKYDSFSYAGAIVTATYSDSTNSDVTASCSFTGYSSTTTGNQTITVTYVDPDDSSSSWSDTYIVIVNPQTLTLNETEVSGMPNETANLTATATNFSGNITYTWVSGNTSIATVSGNGANATVKYVAAGETTITCTATYGNQTANASCTVTVQSPNIYNLVTRPSQLSNDDEILIVAKSGDNYFALSDEYINGSTYYLKADSVTVTNNQITSDTATAWTVTRPGNDYNVFNFVSGNSKTLGNYINSSHYNITTETSATGYSADWLFTVPDYSTGAGNLKGTTNAVYLTYKLYNTTNEFCGASSDPFSTYPIYIFKKGEVTNEVPITSISVTPESVSLDLNETKQLTATCYPADTTQNNLTWISNLTSKATVSNTGLVTAKAAGEATITVFYDANGNGTWNTGEPSDTCTVTVTASGTKTYTLTIKASDFNTTSYAKNNGEHTSTATATDSSTLSITWYSNQVMQQSSAMQWQKNTGYIYNITSLGTITSVTVNSSSGSFTTYYGTSSHPTSGTTVGNGYFTVQVGGATGKTTSIVIVFKK